MTKNGSQMERDLDLTIDVRYLPKGRRDEAVLRTISAMRIGHSVLVVSDSDFHALQSDLDLEYPRKFMVSPMSDGPLYHRALIKKVGDTPPFRAVWENTSAPSWSVVCDP